MDFQIVNFINQFGHGTFLDIISQYISRSQSMLIIRAIVITIALFLKKKYWRFVLLSFVFAGTLFYVTSEIGFKKLLTQETGIMPRPYVTHTESISPIGKNYSDSSFPSSHIVFTVSMITVLIMVFPAMWPYAILYALIMAWSRMYNGMHYPSDILAGAIFGILCGWISVVLSKKVFPSV